jgi:hypothetical protein
MSFSAIINLIMAIPKLWQVYKEILAAVDSFNQKKIDKAHDEATKKLSDAKTIEEIKDATRKLADNP